MGISGGVLPDATGGRRSTAGNLDERTDKATKVLSVYTWALEGVGLIGGYGSLALGAAGVYFTLLARLYRAASLMVLNMEVRSALVQDALENAVKRAAKTAASSVAPGGGTVGAGNAA